MSNADETADELLERVRKAGEIQHELTKSVFDDHLEGTKQLLSMHKLPRSVVIDQRSMPITMQAPTPDGKSSSVPAATSKLGRLAKAATIGAALLSTGGIGAGVTAWLLGGETKETTTQQGSLLQFLEDGGFHVPDRDGAPGQPTAPE